MKRERKQNLKLEIKLLSAKCFVELLKIRQSITCNLDMKAFDTHVKLFKTALIQAMDNCMNLTTTKEETKYVNKRWEKDVKRFCYLCLTNMLNYNINLEIDDGLDGSLYSKVYIGIVSLKSEFEQYF